MSNIKLEPFRSLNDFLMEEFQLPNFADLERWNGRVEKNLIYYQTNYFLVFIGIFGLVGLLHPGQMLLGLTAVAGMLYLYRYLAKNQTVVHSAQKKHPFLCLGVVFGAGYLIINLVGSVLVFVFGIVLPLAVILVHASLRTRSAKNKIVNQMDKLGVKKTPMGLILDEFGMALENIKD